MVSNEGLSTTGSSQGADTGRATTFVALADLKLGDNYRAFTESDSERDELRLLAESIATLGLGSPVLVREVATLGGCEYRLVAGERRVRAHLMLATEGRAAANGRGGCVEALVRVMSDREAAAAMLTENGARLDPPPVDEARGYRRAMDAFGLTAGEVAAMAGVGAYRVTMRLRLLELSEVALDWVRTGALPVGLAEVMSALDGNRQALMLAAWEASGGTIAMSGWRALVGERLAEQSAEVMFDADEFLRVAEMAEGVARRVPNAKVLRSHLRRALAAMEAAGIAGELCADIRADWLPSWGTPRKVEVGR